MGDFFYYGQKDTIQRLNELAGRGAVVASYVPKVGMSPLAGPNGRMHPIWLDPNIPIQTSARVCSGPTAKYGYTYLAQGAPTTRWILIATLSADVDSAYANLVIKGVLNNGWASSTSSPFTIFMGIRGGFYVDWHLEGPIIWQSRIMVCKRADGKHDVYAFFDANVFASISFDLTGIQTITYAEPVEITTAPTGTIVFDSATSPGNPIHIAPRWRGVGSSNRSMLFNQGVQVGNGTITTSFIAAGAAQNELVAGVGKEVLRLGVGGIDSIAHPGCFGFLASAGTGPTQKEGYRLSIQAYDAGSSTWSPELLSIKGDGAVYMPLLKVGSTDASTLHHNISRGNSQGNEILYVGRDGAANPSIAVLAADGTGGWNASGNVLYIGKNSSSGRSVSSGGTVNTMGNDYAEYIFKSSICGIVASGQIVGISADNKVTDQWADAVIFSVKSTAPSFVGGDSWANDVGPRPSPRAGPAPTEPLRRQDVVAQQPVPNTNPQEYEDVVTEAGDSDDVWAEKQATFTAALAAHNISVQQDAQSMAAFDAALEAERQKVDRITIAGRVPVNVLGAQPGDYIVPVQDGAGIKGIAVHEDNLSMKQYLHAVGRVISIEPDGRAYVMVKAV